VVPQCPATPPVWCDAVGPAEASLAVDVWPAEDASETRAEPWGAIVEGAQGFAHVWLDLGVTLPGATEPSRIVRIRGALCVGGQVIGTALRSLKLTRGSDGRYVAIGQSVPLVIAVLPGIAFEFCGYWATARLQVIDEVAGAWGQGDAMVRLYEKPVGLR
jgi:hypothetical protein